MDLFTRVEMHERVGESAGEGSAPARPMSSVSVSRAAAPAAARSGRAPAVRAAEPSSRPRSVAPECGARMSIVLLASVGAHVVLATVLAALPAGSSILGRPETVEIEMFIPAPAIVPQEEPAIVPEPVAPEAAPEIAHEPVREARRAEPEIVPEIAPAPEPEPAAALAPSAPPSLDDVFGDPPPPMDAMTATGEGGFAIAAGSPDGRAGGVAGGQGHTVGAGGTGSGAGPAVTGPSTDAIRRARRSYARAVHDLLAQSARYPVAARAQRLNGRVELALRIAEDGRLIAARVTGSCGYPVLDEAALATARDIGRFPTPPSIVAWNAGEELRTSLVYEHPR